MKKGEADKARLEHMLAAIDFICRHTVQLDDNAFYRDEVLKFAIVKQIEIIGEAANFLSPDLHTQYPEVPWRALTGIRNRLAHAYFQIDWTIVWEAASEEIPAMREPIERILQHLPG